MLGLTVNPEVLEWALDRSGVSDALKEKFPKLNKWLTGEDNPSLKQLEAFSQASRVPIGYLLCKEPPDEKLPVTDFRTVAGKNVRRPSPDLLDMLYLCQRRQAWYQEYAEMTGETPREFVGSAKIEENPATVAQKISKRIEFDLNARASAKKPEDVFRLLVEQTETAGVLVMVSGVVGSNNFRKLDPEEFRGFVLADAMAPLIFINGSDAKAAQMFTLAHELAHVWLGESGVSNAGLSIFPSQRIEQWCNAVAAELLVPLAELKKAFNSVSQPMDELDGLVKQFKVSRLVLIRRMLDAGILTQEGFRQAYAMEVGRLRTLAAKGKGGGDYYLTQPAKLSRRFAKAVIVSTYEGQTLFTDAFRMLGVKKEQTLRELGRTLNIFP